MTSFLPYSYNLITIQSKSVEHATVVNIREEKRREEEKRKRGEKRRREKKEKEGR
jgi:hypothetical protein